MDKMLKLKEKDYQSGLKTQTPPKKNVCCLQVTLIECNHRKRLKTWEKIYYANTSHKDLAKLS